MGIFENRSINFAQLNREGVSNQPVLNVLFNEMFSWILL